MAHRQSITVVVRKDFPERGPFAAHIRERGGFGWRECLRDVRPFLRDGFRVIEIYDPARRYTDRDSAGN